MTNHICLFTEKTIPPIWEAGGKAKSLIETVNAGFRVPDGMVLCTSFFEPWLEQLKKTEEWVAVLENMTKENCDTLKKITERYRFNDSQKSDFAAKLSSIDASVFAVRSSSPEEDLSNTSFAGMYETRLGVAREDLERHIAAVFSSMLDFRVMEYKKNIGRQISESKIAIIVQKQLASEVSGIGFSINPQNNCYDEVVVNASFGLGEYIVSGVVSPDQYIVDTVTGMIIERKINDKKNALLLSKDGKLERITCKDSTAQALPDSSVMEVASLIKNCEKYYGVPIDTEWAYENRKLYLLQARPVTTYFPLYEEFRTSPGQTKNLYLDLVKMTQGFDKSMSELGSDIFAKMIEAAKQGIMPVGEGGVIRCIHGRIYLYVNYMCAALGKALVRKTFGSYDSATKSILDNFSFKGYMPDKKPVKVKGVLVKSMKFGLKSMGPMLKANKDFMSAVEAYLSCAEDAAKELDSMRGAVTDFASQVDHALEIFDKLMQAFMPLGLSFLAEKGLKKLFGGKGLDEDIVALNMDMSGNPTSEMGHLQARLASFRDFAACDNDNEFIEKIQSNGFSKEFMAAYKEYMKRFGCRCINEIDIASIRHHEDLRLLYHTLKQINTSDNALLTVKERKHKAYGRLLKEAQAMRKEGQFLKLAERLEWMGLREHPKYAFVYAVDILRQNVLDIAREFTAQGRLLNEQDIFMMGVSQVSRAQNDSSFDIASIAARNKKSRELADRVNNWPCIIDSRGKIYTARRKSESGDLLGDSVSHGLARGTAKVMHFPFEKELNKGDILVATATEPTWTPMFINASAVVMEIGGPLQHGAIIAREYGIPCVTGIANATSVIKDGDILEVDGTNGIVKILQA